MVDDFCCLTNHLHNNGITKEQFVSVLGNGKLNSVIPQLKEELVQLHGEELAAELSAFIGSYAHNTYAKGPAKGVGAGRFGTICMPLAFFA